MAVLEACRAWIRARGQVSISRGLVRSLPKSLTASGSRLVAGWLDIARSIHQGFGQRHTQLSKAPGGEVERRHVGEKAATLLRLSTCPENLTAASCELRATMITAHDNKLAATP